MPASTASSEIDVGGALTIDHFRPTAHGGNDDFENLLYACSRCNSYKAAWWPQKPGESHLWNPRQSPLTEHFLKLPDGTLRGKTVAGAFTVQRLRLNRPQLIAYRHRKARSLERTRLLRRYAEIIASLQQSSRQQALLLDEHRVLLAEYQSLLRLLIQIRSGDKENQT